MKSSISTGALLAAVLLIISANACGPRKGYIELSEQPAELVKTALVRTPSPIFRDGKDLILIKSIDSKKPTFLESTAVVSPGRHAYQVQVELRHNAKDPSKTFITRADTTLEFYAEADHEYLIDAKEDADGLWIWIIDIKDKTVVAGDPPRTLPQEQKVRPMWDKGEKSP